MPQSRNYDRITKAFYYWLSSRKGNNQMTREEWINWWKESGKFEERGCHTGEYFMSRLDKGLPFDLSNIELRKHKPGMRRSSRDPH